MSQVSEVPLVRKGRKVLQALWDPRVLSVKQDRLVLRGLPVSPAQRVHKVLLVLPDRSDPRALQVKSVPLVLRDLPV